MWFIKYEILTDQRDADNEIEPVKRIVSRREYKKLKSRCPLVRRHYFFFTSSSDWWSLLSMRNKINIIGIAVAIILSALNLWSCVIC